MLGKADAFIEQASYVLAAALVAMLFVGPRLLAEDKPSERGTAAAAGYGDKAPGDGPQKIDAESGKKLFVANCGSCHRLADAGTTGASGPRLDGTEVELQAALTTILQGKGEMPGFADKFDKREAAAVAVYLFEASK